MTESVTKKIASTIHKFRAESGLSQQELADRMHLTRPCISNWENEKSEPSSSQLYQLAQVFGTDIGSLFGEQGKRKIAIVFDTSTLMKRPAILKDAIRRFDEIIIPDVVISELNGIKDRSSGPAKRQAWLAMSNVNALKDRLIIAPCDRKRGIPDEMIAAIGVDRARRAVYDKVYIFSDDIYFQFLGRDESNLSVLSSKDYGDLFNDPNPSYDLLKTGAFFAAIKARDRKYLESGDIADIDLNKVDPETGLTPLIQAIRNRDVETVRILTNQADRIDLNAKDKQKHELTPLGHAVQVRAMEILHILVEYGAEIDLGSSGKNFGNTPLMIAAWDGFLDGVRYLLSMGSSPNQQDSNGFTPLAKACIKGHIEIAELLIGLTDTRIRDRSNLIARDHIAKKTQNMRLMKLFSQRGEILGGQL